MPSIYGVDSLKTKKLLKDLELIERTNIKSIFYFTNCYKSNSDYYEVSYCEIYNEFQLAHMKYVGNELYSYSGDVHIRAKTHKEFNTKLEDFIKSKSTTDEA